MSRITHLMAAMWRHERLKARKDALLAFGIGFAMCLIAWACLIRAEFDKGFNFGVVLALFIASGCAYAMGLRVWDAHKLTMSLDDYEEQEEAKREARL